MSCYLYREVLLLDAPGAKDPMEVSALERHAATCPECGPALENLRSTRAVVGSSEEIEVPPGARARVLEGIEQRTQPRSLLVPALAGVAAIALVYITTMDYRPEPRVLSGRVQLMSAADSYAKGDKLPSASWLSMAEPAKIDLGVARASGDANVVLQIEEVAVGERPFPSQEQGMRLRLFHGRLDLAVEDDAEPFEVMTPRARVVGTHFTVLSLTSRTMIEVNEGTVSVWPEGVADPTILKRGDRLSVPEQTEPVTRLTPPEPPAAVVEEAAPPPPVKRKPRLVAKKKPVEVPSKKKETAPVKERLAEAQAALHADAPRAARIAEEILDERPPPTIEANALAVLADAYRRSGERIKAADLYQRIARHPSGKPFAEEALFQRAMLLERLGRQGSALRTLAEAHSRFPNGPTAPERHSLIGEIRSKRGEIEQARRAFAEAAEAARAQGDLSTAAACERRKQQIQ